MATVCSKAGGTKNAGRSNNIRTRAGKVKILEQMAPHSLHPQHTRTKATWMSVMDLANLDIRFYLKLFYNFTIGSHRKVENIKKNMQDFEFETKASKL